MKRKNAATISPKQRYQQANQMVTYWVQIRDWQNSEKKAPPDRAQNVPVQCGGGGSSYLSIMSPKLLKTKNPYVSWGGGQLPNFLCWVQICLKPKFPMSSGGGVDFPTFDAESKSA